MAIFVRRPPHVSATRGAHGRPLPVLLIDGPGFGGSEPPSDRFTVGDTARAEVEVLDSLGVERAIIGGTSWGGEVAAHFAVDAPERAAAILLLNTPVGTNRGPGRFVGSWGLTILTRLFGGLDATMRATAGA